DPVRRGDLRVRRIAQISEDGGDRDIEHVVTKAPAVRPSARDGTVVEEAGLHFACQHVVAEDSEPAESLVVAVPLEVLSAAGQSCLVCRKIDFDHVGDEDLHKIGAVLFRCYLLTIEDKRVDEFRQLRRTSVFVEDRRIVGRLSAVVAILVLDRDEAFVEERVALPSHLDEAPGFHRSTCIRPIIQDAHLRAARGGVNTHDLLIATKIADRDLERHFVEIEATLAVESCLAAAELQQVEDGLNVGVETVFTLAGERTMAATQRGDRLARIAIEVFLARDAGLGRVLPVVVIVVTGCRVALVIRRHHASSQLSAHAGSTIHSRHRVTLHQVLIRIIDVLDHPRERLQDCVLLFEGGGEAELISQSRAPSRHIVARQDVDLIKHTVVEPVVVWADARLFERVNCQRSEEHLGVVRLTVVKERVDVRRIRRIVKGDKWSVHMTGRVNSHRSSKRKERCAEGGCQVEGR
ncbi:MAG: hypothetical protein AVDCRST_MAG42-263, partial [uncultured Chthoniobacterales bacterium]